MQCIRALRPTIISNLFSWFSDSWQIYWSRSLICWIRCRAIGAEDFIIKPLQATDIHRLRDYARPASLTSKAGAKRKNSSDLIAEKSDSERRPRLAGVAAAWGIKLTISDGALIVSFRVQIILSPCCFSSSSVLNGSTASIFTVTFFFLLL